MINTTRPMPTMVLTLMLALLLLSEWEERRSPGAQQRSACQCCPQRQIGAVASLGNIRNRLQLVVEFGHHGLALMDGDGHIRRQNIGLVGLVGDLRNHIVADAQTVNFDLPVLIGHIVLGESVAGDVSAAHPEGKALQPVVLRGFLNAEAAGLRCVHEALSGLVFYDDGSTVFCDGESINEFYIAEERTPTTTEIASAFSISRSSAYRYLVYLSENHDIAYEKGEIRTSKMNRINLNGSRAAIVGSIPCGEATSEEECVEEYVKLPESLFG